MCGGGGTAYYISLLIPEDSVSYPKLKSNGKGSTDFNSVTRIESERFYLHNYYDGLSKRH